MIHEKNWRRVWEKKKRKEKKREKKDYACNFMRN